MVQEKFAILRILDSFEDTNGKIITTFKWRMYQVLEVWDNPKQFDCCAEIKDKDLILAIVQVWLKYKIKELLKPWHI